MKVRKVSMRVASLFLWVVMFVTAACIGYAAGTQDSGNDVVIETVEPETSEDVIEETTTSEAEEKVLIEYTKDDLTVIPDKYNTGAKGEFEVVEIGATVNGIKFKSASDNTRNVIDFGYSNTDIEGTVVFENYDFSKYSVWSYNEELVDRDITVVFNNCIFSEITVGKAENRLSFEFNNCTIAKFVGSNSTFNNCKLGEGCCKDAIVPFRDVIVNSCFFGNMSSVGETGAEIHTDGTQIYGYKDIDVENVHYSNCRFEIPPLSVEGSNVSVNACLMLQLEYSNGNDISFSDCVINGGSYSIFARGVKGYTLENVKFERIRSGCAKIYGTLYSDISPAVEMYDFSETDSLYIASVWKENNSTCFSVSNDTRYERELTIITDCGQYEYVIPACPTGEEIVVGMLYEDMPFDIKIVIPEDCEYAVCYDSTYEGAAGQIRFINWSGESVYLDKETVDALTSKADEIISAGACGENIEYTLTRSGVLTLSGQGSTYHYHSSKLPPWNEYADIIKEIVICEGIEEIGTQIFRKCVAVQKVSLPDGLKTIGQRAFAYCTSLTSIILPASIEYIGDYVFVSSALREICYEGTEWNRVELGSGNDNLEGMVQYIPTAFIYLKIL